MNLVNSQQLFD